MLIGLLGFVFISNAFAINMVCLSLIHSFCFLAIICIYKPKLIDTYFKFLSRYFNSPPKPHAFAYLPLESKAGMWITLIASSSGAVVLSVDYSDLWGIINSLIPNITIPSIFTFPSLNIPSFPSCALPHIFSPLSDNPNSLTDYAWQLQPHKQTYMFINSPNLWYTRNVVYLFNNPLFLGIASFALITVIYRLMEFVLDFFNAMCNVFNTWPILIQPHLFLNLFRGVTDPWLIPLRDLVSIARFRFLGIIRFIAEARIRGRGINIDMISISYMFRRILLQRPHIGNVAIAGITTLLTIAQLNPFFGLGLDYQGLFDCFWDLVAILDDILEDLLDSSDDSESDDSSFSDSE